LISAFLPGFGPAAPRGVDGFGAQRDDLVHGVHPGDHLTEHRVATGIERGLRRDIDEELRAARILVRVGLIAEPRGRDRAAHVRVHHLAGVGLALDLGRHGVTRPTDAVVVGVGVLRVRVAAWIMKPGMTR
jgi:hypothetical protein